MIVIQLFKVFFWILAMAMAAGLAVCYAIRWYDMSMGRYSPDRSWIDALAERNLRPVRSYFAEWIYLILYCLMYVPGIALWLAGKRGSIPSGSRAAKGEPLVVLIHGLMGTSANMWILWLRLKRRGIRNVAVYDYASTKGTWEENRDLLRDFIFKAVDQTGAEGIFLVSHSMGGLIAHEYAMEYGAMKGGTLAHITLGAPYRGSRLASLGLSQAARRLSAANPYFTWVASRKPDAPVYCMGSVFDQMVVPFDNFSHPMATSAELVDTCGHAGLLFDGRVFRRILDWMADAAPERAVISSPPL